MAKAAILGFGTVGSGVWEIFEKSDFTKKAGEKIEVAHILDIRDFSDHPKKELFMKNFDDILNDKEVGFAAETMGGLHPAYEYTKALLERGVSVATSNKELVATYGPELLKTACDNGCRYLFEASVGGGIPIIRPLTSCLLANTVERIAGILNGTTNFILTDMIEHNTSFDAALSQAQELGYAERNPAADIEGHDACRKTAILASMAWGDFVDYNDIHTEGITKITSEDVSYAARFGKVIKLIGCAEKNADGSICACVAPMLVDNSDPLSGVRDVFNAIAVRGDFLGDAMFYGRGAGKLATASAVCADVIDMVKSPKPGAAPLLWATGGARISPEEEKERRFFVKTAAPQSKIEELFGEVETAEGVKDGEIGFITPVMSLCALEGKLAKIGGEYMRVLD